MSTNKENVAIGSFAVVSIVPDGSTVTSTAPVAGEIDLGYITTDGVTITPSVDRTEIAMLGGDIVRTLKRNPKVDYGFTLGEVTPAGVRLFYGKTPDASGKVAWDPSFTWRGQLRVDLQDEDADSGDLYTRVTHFIPDGEVTANDALTIKDDTPHGLGLTVTAYKKNGRCADVFFADFVTAG